MENGITATAAAEAEAEATELQQPAIPVELLMCPKRERREWSGRGGRGDGKQIANACLPVSKSHLRATFKM